MYTRCSHGHRAPHARRVRPAVSVMLVMHEWSGIQGGFRTVAQGLRFVVPLDQKTHRQRQHRMLSCIPFFRV